MTSPFGAQSTPWGLSSGGSSSQSVAISTTGVTRKFGCNAAIASAVPTAIAATGGSVIKVEAEASFSRVRIWNLQRNPYGSSGWKFAVAATDEHRIDSVTNAFIPRKAGASYNVLTSITSDYGWFLATWGAGGVDVLGPAISPNEYIGDKKSGKVYPSTDFAQFAAFNLATDNALGDAIVSDWIPCKSMPPAATTFSGTTRPFLLVKSYRSGLGFPLECQDPANANQAQTLTMYNGYLAGTSGIRCLYTAGYTGGDGIATLTLIPASAPVYTGTFGQGQMPNIIVEFDYDVPCRSFALAGDSNTESFTWMSDAIAQVSTETTPLASCNLGMSTNRSVQYFNWLDMMVSKGAGFTDWIIPSSSHNDWTVIGRSVSGHQETYIVYLEWMKAEIMAKLNEADKLGITVWIWTSWQGYLGAGNASNDPNMVEYLTWIRALCTAGRAKLIDIAASWVSTYSSDGNVHPNASGYAYCLGVANAAIAAQI